ncbi:MAG: polysaccharide deacetylase family protein [Candidatus Zixiibacteriota bacterium]
MMVKLKRFIKMIIAGLAHYLGFIKRGDTNRFIILMYHRVSENYAFENKYTQSEINISQEHFDCQMKRLARDYHVVSFDDLIEMLNNGGSVPPRMAVITFDDGWYDNYEVAFPILKKYNLPATIFLATDFIGTDQIMWFLKLGVLLNGDNALITRFVSELNGLIEVEGGAPIVLGSDPMVNRNIILTSSKNIDFEKLISLVDEYYIKGETGFPDANGRQWMLDWDNIKEMRQDGITFGSHGKSHRILKGLNIEQIEAETAESKLIIENKLGETINHFAYPNGDYDENCITALKKTGYKSAVAIYPQGKNEIKMFALNRVGMHQNVSEGVMGGFSKVLFESRIHQFFKPMGR